MSDKQIAENLRRHEELLKKRREKNCQGLGDLMTKLMLMGKDPIKFFEKVMDEMDWMIFLFYCLYSNNICLMFSQNVSIF